MQKNIYTLYDEKAFTYCHPFYCVNDQVALRSLAIAATDPNSEISKAPLDYSLYCIGVFDDNLGVITPHQAPINLGKYTIAEV